MDDRVAGVLEYERSEGVVDLFHTEVDPSLRNRGLGAELVRYALDDARGRGERVVPTCPFVAAILSASS